MIYGTQPRVLRCAALAVLFSCVGCRLSADHEPSSDRKPQNTPSTELQLAAAPPKAEAPSGQGSLSIDLKKILEEKDAKLQQRELIKLIEGFKGKPDTNTEAILGQLRADSKILSAILEKIKDGKISTESDFLDALSESIRGAELKAKQAAVASGGPPLPSDLGGSPSSRRELPEPGTGCTTISGLLQKWGFTPRERQDSFVIPTTVTIGKESVVQRFSVNTYTVTDLRFPDVVGKEPNLIVGSVLRDLNQNDWVLIGYDMHLRTPLLVRPSTTDSGLLESVALKTESVKGEMLKLPTVVSRKEADGSVFTAEISIYFRDSTKPLYDSGSNIRDAVEKIAAALQYMPSSSIKPLKEIYLDTASFNFHLLAHSTEGSSIGSVDGIMLPTVPGLLTPAVVLGLRKGIHIHWTAAHELAHVVAENIFGHFNPTRPDFHLYSAIQASNAKDWLKSVEADRSRGADDKPVSAYSKTNDAELFAEVYAAYVLSGGGILSYGMRQTHLEKFRFIDRLLGIDSTAKEKVVANRQFKKDMLTIVTWGSFWTSLYYSKSIATWIKGQALYILGNDREK